MLDDDEIPSDDHDFEAEAQRVSVPITDAYGTPYTIGAPVLNFHNGDNGVVLGFVDGRVEVCFGTTVQLMDSRRQIEMIVDGPPRKVPPPPPRPPRSPKSPKVPKKAPPRVDQQASTVAQLQSDAKIADDTPKPESKSEPEPEPKSESKPEPEPEPNSLIATSVDLAGYTLFPPVPELSDAKATTWQIFCGDGAAGLLSQVEVDHVICDVPYSKAVEDGNAAETTRDNAFGFEAMTSDLMERLAQSIGARCRRWCLLMTSDDEVHLWRAALKRAGMKIVRVGHWVRVGTKPQMNGKCPAQAVEYIIIAHSNFSGTKWNGGGKPALWYANIVHGDERRHPTQKPAALLKQLIEDFTDRGETIADVTAGSFVTGITAVSLGRNFLGWDIESKYVEQARDLFTMPLFDNVPINAALFAEPRASSRVATARSYLDREILRAVTTAPGIQMPDLLLRLSDSDRTEVTRALSRLRKKQLLRSDGKTSAARYYGMSQSDREEIAQRDKAKVQALAARDAELQTPEQPVEASLQLVVQVEESPTSTDVDDRVMPHGGFEDDIENQIEQDDEPDFSTDWIHDAEPPSSDDVFIDQTVDSTGDEP